jgi:hypothetical protein
MKLRFLPFAGILLAASLTVAACGSSQSSSSAAARATRQASPARSSTAPADTAATAPASSPSGTAGDSSGQPVSASSPANDAGFASALAAWKNAAAAPAATMNQYLQQAADDLHATGNSGYRTAIAELTYLANLPATNDTAKQRANAQSDVRALDTFFKTPGLLA